ncbi:MAG: PD-(D/E)XK nuclease domain-containing protein [Candidatus Sericytochromatia bacterium]
MIKSSFYFLLLTFYSFYIFEFKMTNPESGLRQIKDKSYYESYLATNKEIVLVAISFDSENKNIKEWKTEIYRNDME